MKLSTFLAYLIAFSLISAFFTISLYEYFIIEKVYTVDMKLRVSDHFGLNADSDSLNFGSLMPETEGLRDLIVENKADYPLKVEVSTPGQISKWIKISDNNFVLDSGQSKNLTFVAFAPKIGYGQYNGSVKVIFKKVLFG